MVKKISFMAKGKNLLAGMARRVKRISPQLGAFYLLVALGIIGLLMMLLRPDPRLGKAAEQVPQLAAAIRQKFQMRSDYRGLNTAEALRLKAAPEEMLGKDGLKNALGQPVLVGSGAEGAALMPGARRFDIVYTGLSQKECIGIAAYHLSEKDRLGLNYITIAAEGKEKTFSWGGEHPLPVERKAAEKACGLQNILIFGYE